MIITVLTGRRPGLTKRTLDSLPRFLTQETVLVLNNGNDKETRTLLGKYNFIDRILFTKEFLTNGQAVSLLANEAKDSKKTYWLLLENDWECKNSKNWLILAKELLNKPNIGQVRLRLNDEKVLNYNMVDKHMIRWTSTKEFKTGNGHYTNNPNLMKVNNIKYLFPSFDEKHTQKKFHYQGWSIVQLIPGTFEHIGVESLEKHKW
jgi:hypothetical protein